MLRVSTQYNTGLKTLGCGHISILSAFDLGADLEMGNLKLREVADIGRMHSKEEVLPLSREGKKSDVELLTALHDLTRTLYSGCLA